MIHLEEFILNNYSKGFALDLAHFLAQNQERIPELLQIIYREEEPISRRAAWYFSTFFDEYPTLVVPYVDELIAHLSEVRSQAVLRCFLRTISRCKIPEAYHAFLIEFSSEVIMNSRSEIAVKAMAMDIFFQIAKFQPDLFTELELMIDFIYPEGSRGIQNKCRNLLRSIEKIRAKN